jgi:hypothetical protein
MRRCGRPPALARAAAGFGEGGRPPLRRRPPWPPQPNLPACFPPLLILLATTLAPRFGRAPCSKRPCSSGSGAGADRASLQARSTPHAACSTPYLDKQPPCPPRRPACRPMARGERPRPPCVPCVRARSSASRPRAPQSSVWGPGIPPPSLLTFFAQSAARIWLPRAGRAAAPPRGAGEAARPRRRGPSMPRRARCLPPLPPPELAVPIASMRPSGCRRLPPFAIPPARCTAAQPRAPAPCWPPQALISSRDTMPVGAVPRLAPRPGGKQRTRPAARADP